MPGYKVIDGVRYEKELLGIAEDAASQGGVNEGIAKKIWVSALDGPGVTETESRTIGYILSKFAVDADAKAYLEEKLWGQSELTVPQRRLLKLKEIFRYMDEDGNGSVDLAEFQAATSNPTMLKLFSYMDNKGDKNGSLSLDEWLDTMTKVGLSMDDATFERDLASMLTKQTKGGTTTPPKRAVTLDEETPPKRQFTEAELSEEIAGIVWSCNLASPTITLGKLRAELETKLGLRPGELEPQKDHIDELVNAAIHSRLASEDADSEQGERKSKKAKKEKKEERTRKHKPRSTKAKEGKKEKKDKKEKRERLSEGRPELQEVKRKHDPRIKEAKKEKVKRLSAGEVLPVRIGDTKLEVQIKTLPSGLQSMFMCENVVIKADGAERKLQCLIQCVVRD